MPPEDAALRARSFWSGTLTFGLVSIPVNLFPASRSQRVSLRMLSPEGTPLSRRYFCPKEEKEIPSDEIVRGYEIDEDEFVLVTDEELESLAPERTRDIDLRRFVPADAIDPIYFERAYFLTPGGDSTKPYRLLAETMERTGRAGIATFVMRGKEYLVAILAENGILRAETLRFRDEVRSAGDVGLSAPAKPKAAEVRKVGKAIDKLEKKTLAESELEERGSKRLLALIERKRKKGEDVVAAPEAEEDEADVIDLMEVLKRSMKAAGAGGRTPRAAASRASGSRRGADELAELTKQELYERAQERAIPGRSGMSKKELVDALRRGA
ncbi:MAG TPA: Ku protein [Longimicrobiales bacterium]|nr:Ku protein [Longimicrobiales bacterium]